MCDINTNKLFWVNIVSCICYPMYIWMLCVIE